MYSLNHISHECAIAMIERVVSQDVNVQHVYVDTVALGGNTMLNDDEIAELFE